MLIAVDVMRFSPASVALTTICFFFFFSFLSFLSPTNDHLKTTNKIEMHLMNDICSHSHIDQRDKRIGAFNRHKKISCFLSEKIFRSAL